MQLLIGYVLGAIISRWAYKWAIKYQGQDSKLEPEVEIWDEPTRHRPADSTPDFDAD